jgi:selenocysteine lyase/cysteine desulfurase
MDYTLEDYFGKYRNQIIGINQYFLTPYGEQRIIYADWTASGRLYAPIERILSEQVAPFVANTHTETSTTGATMTAAYHQALQIIKRHVGASDKDVIISADSGMTGVVNKLQRILGLRLHERFRPQFDVAADERPIVFITHMEHHSNQTSWLETIAEVIVVRAGDDGLIDLSIWAETVETYSDRPLKIAAVTSCSNVTGIKTPYHQIAEIMHRQNGYCFVDFACSAPYIDINMHPDNPNQHLDAIYFSPHKFLGGPGSTGILVFNSALYTNKIPDVSGGGTVKWTNPWGEHSYIDDIEAREDGGTPPFMQTIRAALCVKLKEEMGVNNILAREREILDILWGELEKTPNLHLLAPHQPMRLGILSFYIDKVHYNLVVRLLSDRFGVQVRGGCSCAGTYGHHLLDVGRELSHNITRQIEEGCLLDKPGWVRLSIHPTTTNQEAEYLAHAVQQVCLNASEWEDDYIYNPQNNEYQHKNHQQEEFYRAQHWFKQPLC